MGVLTKDQAERLYDRIAGVYDRLLMLFRVVGSERWRAKLIENLRLQKGDHVVDLCGGTGVNLPLLYRAVGASGKITIVDLSENMLARAREYAAEEGINNVAFVQADVVEFIFAEGADAVISTFGLEMVPEYATVIEKASDALSASGRIGLMGLKHPEDWPDWLISVGIFLTKPFAVSRDYEDFRPWIAARSFMDEQWFKQHLAGAAYSFVGQKKAVKARTIHQSTLAKTHSSSQ